LTHLLIGLLFLKIPTGVRVSAHQGGEVRQIGLGTTGQVWVTLAPYFFPTLSIAVLIIAYIADFNTLLLLGILGWTTAFHLITNWSETSFRQSDLQKAGILKTILILNLFLALRIQLNGHLLPLVVTLKLKVFVFTIVGIQLLLE
jgi:hypothetical protein